MNRIGFDNDKYLSMQSAHIRERIAQFGDKLYLEFGGKLFDDYHASRVLPGFAPDSKLQMLLQLADQAEMIMKQAKITVNDRTVVPIANDLAKTDGAAAAALELSDGTIVTGSTSDLLGPASAVLLNAIKVLGHIDKHMHLISRTFIEPIQQLKTGYLGSHNPRLHTDEVLIALSMCAVSDPNAKLALEQLPKLSGCQLHVSAILSAVDINTFKKLGIELTNEAVYESVATN